jgi:hypothetical protein
LENDTQDTKSEVISHIISISVFSIYPYCKGKTQGLL